MNYIKKLVPFFEKYPWSWGFISVLVAIMAFYYSANALLSFSNSWDNQHLNNISNSWSISGVMVVWEKNSVSVTNNELKSPTVTEEAQSAQWGKCETKLRAFYRRLDRDDIKSARGLFDDHMIKENVFLEDRLKKFILDRVAWIFFLEKIQRWWIDNSDYVDRCEFNYFLRYTDKKLQILRNEWWHAVILMDKDKVSDFQIGQLTCFDKNCEDSPLVNLHK